MPTSVVRFSAADPFGPVRSSLSQAANTLGSSTMLPPRPRTLRNPRLVDVRHSSSACDTTIVPSRSGIHPPSPPGPVLERIRPDANHAFVDQGGMPPHNASHLF